MLMAAGRRGFGLHESRKRDRKNYVDVNGRKTGICREDERGFRDFGKIRVRDMLKEEKELGELSSDSEGSPPVCKVEGKRTSEGRRKRKFSPLLRDMDNVKKAGVVGSDGKVDILVTASLPARPPIQDGCVLLSGVDVPAKSESKFVYSDHHYSHESSTHQDYKIYEEDAPVLVRNISSSRWAVGIDEFDDDEAEGYDGDVVSKKKGTPVKESLRRSSKLPIHEFGEISREGPDRRSSPLSESGSADEDGHGNNENECVKSGDEDSDTEADSHLADSDSEVTVVDSSKHVKPPERCIRSCRSVDEFERLNKINEGTYGVVYRARDKMTGDIVALKKVKMEREREGFPLTSLREINILLSFNHPSIVDVKEVVMGSEDSIFMVMEYMDHDLKGLMESMKQPFSQSEVKCLMLQLLEGVKFLHDNWVLHRDLKTSNLLFNNCGELKICDFGLSRQYGSPLKPYTPLVVTLWYRAPELLLGMKKYSTAIDMWSLGCIMAETLSKEPLFNGKSELDQLGKIFRILGTPNDNLWPGFTKLPGAKVNFVKQPYNKLREKFPPASFSGRPTLSERGFDLLNKLLTYDPDKRITAEAALKHEWFTEPPFPKMKGLMPTYPSQNTHDRHLVKILRSPDPFEELKNEMQQA